MGSEKHNAGNCDVCAAREEAEAIGATPIGGHSPRRIEVIAKQLTEVIYHTDTASIRRLLIEFADEIKREATEP